MAKPTDPRTSLADWFVEQMRKPGALPEREPVEPPPPRATGEPRDAPRPQPRTAVESNDAPRPPTPDAEMERVLACPGSLSAREALAAEWRERRDLRAELLDKQLRLRRHRLAQTLSSDEANALDREIFVLVRNHGRRWAGEIHGLVAGYAFHRGCVAEVSLPGAAFALVMPRLLALAPIQHVNLTAPLAMEAVVGCPLLEKVASLRISDLGPAFGDREASLLANSPHAKNLVWISLTDGSVSTPGVEALAASPHLQRCAYLNLGGNPRDATPAVWSYEGIEHRVRSAWAEELDQRFGPRPWLAVPAEDAPWPPHRDDLATVP